jgi:hypothetical protein
VVIVLVLLDLTEEELELFEEVITCYYDTVGSSGGWNADELSKLSKLSKKLEATIKVFTNKGY